MSTPPPSDRSRVRRLPERAAYDAATIHAILDAGLICHVGLVDQGQALVIPMLYARDGDRLLLHGSPGSRLLRRLGEGAEATATITLLDGLVLARSVFHHSVNYRSVMVFGHGSAVEGDEARLAALQVITEHLAPGRWGDARLPDPKELRQTQIVALSIDEASAKQRTGGPKDDEEDYALPVWAGVLPLALQAGAPQADPRLPATTPLPGYLADY